MCGIDKDSNSNIKLTYNVYKLNCLDYTYTTFEYMGLTLSSGRMDSVEPIQVSVLVRNTGEMTGDEVVQVYVRDEAASLPVPRHSLAAFTRVHLKPGEEQRVNLTVEPRAFALADQDGNWIIENGTFTVFVGGGQPGTPGVLDAAVEFAGETSVLD